MLALPTFRLTKTVNSLKATASREKIPARLRRSSSVHIINTRRNKASAEAKDTVKLEHIKRAFQCAGFYSSPSKLAISRIDKIGEIVLISAFGSIYSNYTSSLLQNPVRVEQIFLQKYPPFNSQRDFVLREYFPFVFAQTVSNLCAGEDKSVLEDGGRNSFGDLLRRHSGFNSW